MLSRRRFGHISGLAAASLALPALSRDLAAPDFKLQIAPLLIEVSATKQYRTVAYNNQVPGPLLRMKQGRPYTIEVQNHSQDPEVVHWHGLFLPSDIDGAVEEGTPMIAPGASARYTFRPDPPGFRWFHTHTFAGKHLNKAQYGGQHGFLLIEGHDDAGAYDREIFLGLHDWGAHLMGSDDGSMNPAYDTSTINGKMLGSGDPVRVRQGERVLMQVLNSSATEVHWLALAGHSFHILALDGNPVPRPQTVSMLRLAPAERVSAIVAMNAPGVWVLGEVRKHVRAAGMGIVVEYANATGEPIWNQPEELVWNYQQFCGERPASPTADEAQRIELVFDSKFQGHGDEELWRINGQSYPQTSAPVLQAGQRYRLVMRNQSQDDHPMHLHRHTFQVRRVDESAELQGLRKDVLLVRAGRTAEVEFLADNPGKTLFHCHQQDHMDRGFMMVFTYA